MNSHKLTPEHKKKILKAISKGSSIKNIALECAVSRNSIYWFLNRNKKDWEIAKNRKKAIAQGIFES